LSYEYIIILWYQFWLFRISWVDYITMVLQLYLHKNYVSACKFFQITFKLLLVRFDVVCTMWVVQLYICWHSSRWNFYNRWTVVSASAIAWPIYTNLIMLWCLTTVNIFDISITFVICKWRNNKCLLSFNVRQVEGSKD